MTETIIDNKLAGLLTYVSFVTRSGRPVLLELDGRYFYLRFVEEINFMEKELLRYQGYEVKVYPNIKCSFSPKRYTYDNLKEIWEYEGQLLGCIATNNIWELMPVGLDWLKENKEYRVFITGTPKEYESYYI
jgi:hypothetical protein